MRVLFVPLRLKAAVSFLLLFVPVAALQIVVTTRSPYWQLPIPSMLTWALAVILLSLPLMVWIAYGRRWAFHVSVILGGFWCAWSAWSALGSNNPALGFFTIGLGLLLLISYSLIRGELKRSFFEPRLAWYEGAPGTIPHLQCMFASRDGERTFRVNRIDLDGAYIVGDTDASFLEKALPVQNFRFSYRGCDVSCSAVPVTLYKTQGRAIGAGIQFVGMTADGRKDLCDFLECLRGEGHV